MKDGIVLFAHGSRDPEWSRPFEDISQALERRLPRTSVRLAFLELRRPTLDEAVDSLAAAGAKSVRIVPLFLGPGGHLKDDLPKLAAVAAARHPGLKLALEKPIGEQRAVIMAIVEAIAKFAVQ